MIKTSFKKLQIWQRSINLCKEIYELTNQFPKEEQYGIVSQIRRASVSMPSNIVEGSQRNSKNDLLPLLKTKI